MSEEIYENGGLSVKVLPKTSVGDFFEVLNFEICINGEKRIDSISSIENINLFMYLVRQNNLAKAYYYIIL